MVLFLPFNVAIHDLGGQVSSSACNHNLFAEIESGTSPKFIGAKSLEAFMKEQECGILREAGRAVKAPSVHSLEEATRLWRSLREPIEIPFLDLVSSFLPFCSSECVRRRCTTLDNRG